MIVSCSIPFTRIRLNPTAEITIGLQQVYDNLAVVLESYTELAKNYAAHLYLKHEEALL